jgi:predicted enzyme related to lactoylglutathione lyase
MNTRYIHTNLIARDWRTLADFYERVFGCVRVPPERDLSGSALEAGTGLPGAHLRGVHLRLPGSGETGPTLEVFSYESMPERLPPACNQPGYAHIAFAVDDVPAARAAVLSAGGMPVGEVVSTPAGEGVVLTWCYVTDPEGNIIELQARTEQPDEALRSERMRRAIALSGRFRSGKTDISTNHDEYLAEAFAQVGKRRRPKAARHDSVVSDKTVQGAS